MPTARRFLDAGAGSNASTAESIASQRPELEPTSNMDTFYWIATLFLLLNLLLGLMRVVRGPTPADRMLAAQLFGTVGVAILLLLAEADSRPALRDVALVLAFLAPVAAVAFVKRHSPRQQ